MVGTVNNIDYSCALQGDTSFSGQTMMQLLYTSLISVDLAQFG